MRNPNDHSDKQSHKVKKVLGGILTILIFSNYYPVYSQQEYIFTQYMFNEAFINPGYVGSKEALSLTALHRQQWTSFPGRPTTMTFNANAPIVANTMGVGLSFLSESIGVSKINLVNAAYAVRIKVTEKGRLSLGAQVGVTNVQQNFSQVTTASTNVDNQFSGDIKYTIPQIGTGLYYYTDLFFTGLSVPNFVTANSSGNGDVHAKIKPALFNYYFVVGRVFKMSENFMLKPQIMMKAMRSSPIQFDLSLNSFIHEFVWLGAAYRSNAALSGMLGIQISPQFLISYSYDYPLTVLNNYDYKVDTHEIVISYLFFYKGNRITTPRYF